MKSLLSEVPSPLLHREAMAGRWQRMPRFYFHLYNDLTTMDEEGQECGDAAAALNRAAFFARDMAAANVCEGHLNLSHRIDVEDEQGALVGTVRFAEAVEIRS